MLTVGNVALLSNASSAINYMIELFIDKKAMLLYPGDIEQSSDFKEFENKDNDGLHECRLGYVSVLGDDKDGLSDVIGENIFELIEDNKTKKSPKPKSIMTYKACFY